MPPLARLLQLSQLVLLDSNSTVHHQPKHKLTPTTILPAGAEGAGAMAEADTARADSQQGSAEQSSGGAASRVDLVPATPETPSQPSDMAMSEEMRTTSRSACPPLTLAMLLLACVLVSAFISVGSDRQYAMCSYNKLPWAP